MDKRKSIVVGIDFTPASRIALDRAFDLAGADASSVLELVVVLAEIDRANEQELQRLDHDFDVSSKQLLEWVEPYCKDRDVRPAIRTHVRIGPAVEMILQVAVDYDADYIVVGTHNRTGFERWRLGSVSEELVRRSRVPVLVAKEKDWSGMPKTPTLEAATPGLPLHQKRAMSAWMMMPDRTTHTSGLI